LLPAADIGAILDVMTTSARPRRHLASSPFAPEPEVVVEQYELDDLVAHDTYGMGRVVQLETGAVMVDFRSQVVRVTSPFAKMSKL
jgi:predicted 2-oxoglutarate/Fe(II)-dependent dioxygenase YbiX